MANEKFSIKEAIAYGWGSFKNQVPFFIGLILVILLITVLPDIVIEKLFEPRTAPFVILKIIVRLIGLMMGMVATRVSLDIHDDGKTDLSRLGELLSYIPYYFGGKILYGLIVLGGMVLLIVPGLIWAYMFLYVGYIIIDKGASPAAALKESREITRGYKMDLFLFSLVIALINLIGAICLFVGLFVTIPMTLMASAYVYRRLNPRAAA